MDPSMLLALGGALKGGGSTRVSSSSSNSLNLAFNPIVNMLGGGGGTTAGDASGSASSAANSSGSDGGGSGLGGLFSYPPPSGRYDVDQAPTGKGTAATAGGDDWVLLLMLGGVALVLVMGMGKKGRK